MDNMEQMQPPSRYQDLNSFWIIRNVLSHALPICKAANICDRSFNPKFATLYCPDINADARKVNNEFVLFVNGKLISFCYSMINAIVETIGIDVRDSVVSISLSKAEMLRKVKKDTLLQQRFIAQLRYAFSGKKYKDYVRPSDYDPFVIELTNCMELFFISHELYHASQKHDLNSSFKFSDNETYNAADSLLRKKQIATGWSYEVLADYHGQYMLSQYARTIDKDYFWDLARLGGLLYLTFDHVYQKAEHIFTYGERQKSYTTRDLDQIGNLVSSFTAQNAADSLLRSVDWSWTSQDHPPYELRSQLIAGMIEKEMSRGGEQKTVSNGFFMIGKHLLAAIDILYNSCEAELINIAKQTNLQR